jgi:hypothetical protein
MDPTATVAVAHATLSVVQERCGPAAAAAAIARVALEKPQEVLQVLSDNGVHGTLLATTAAAIKKASGAAEAAARSAVQDARDAVLVRSQPGHST